MPTLIFPLTFSLAPLPTGTALNADDFADQIVANLQATISGNFLTGQIGGNPPTTNVGPWANNGHWWFWDPGSSTYIQESLTSNFPSGSILSFGGIAAPTGFLLCDGSSYLTATYPALFAVIGTNYGGSGSNFNVPNLVGAFPRGVVAGSIGTTGGSNTVTISTAQLPAHNHVINVTNPPHAHTISPDPHAHTYIAATQPIQAGNTAVGGALPGSTTGATSLTVSTVATTVSATSNNTGSGSAVTITPVYTGVTYIIKV